MIPTISLADTNESLEWSQFPSNPSDERVGLSDIRWSDEWNRLTVHEQNSISPAGGLSTLEPLMSGCISLP